MMNSPIPHKLILPGQVQQNGRVAGTYPIINAMAQGMIDMGKSGIRRMTTRA
jgi:hypothetical protein